MFVQVIQGRTDDAAGLRRQIERWDQELRPGATGWLGSTFGVTADGEAIGIARFESAETAARNSDRPEQGEWWTETEKLFSGPVTFHDSSDVDVFLAGGSDAAGFVQVMQGRVTDLARVRELEAKATETMPTVRPDVIGSVRARYGDGEFTEVVYFTSEAEARAGEAKPMSDEDAAEFADWQDVVKVDRWYDLTEPWFSGP
ncbi:MAG TPA: hypothetical protein VFF24_13705 [Acidimicrobiia bacterium]|nr:hypothetical protein [Acidimicrobiia bacterium]